MKACNKDRRILCVERFRGAQTIRSPSCFIILSFVFSWNRREINFAPISARYSPQLTNHRSLCRRALWIGRKLLKSGFYGDNHAFAFYQTLTLCSLWLIEVQIVLKVWLRALRTLVFHSWRHTVAQSSLGPLCLPRMVWIILQYSGSLVDPILRKREWTKIQRWPYRHRRSDIRRKNRYSN